MLEKYFVSYEEALELKEIGFDIPCLATRVLHGNLTIQTNEVKNSTLESMLPTIVCVPLYQQAFEWFRGGYDLYITIHTHQNKGYTINVERITSKHTELIYSSVISAINGGPFYKSYEEAELSCLKKLIEIVKEKK